MVKWLKYFHFCRGKDQEKKFPGRLVIFLQGKLNNNVGRSVALFPGYFQRSIFKTHARTLFLDPHHGWSMHARKSDTHPSYK